MPPRKYPMQTFWQWVVATARDLSLSRPSLPFTEGDEGLRAFIDSQDRSFKVFLKELLKMPAVRRRQDELDRIAEQWDGGK